MEKRKSAVDLTDLAIGILILGIIVAVGASILTNMKVARVSNLDTYQVANESISPDDGGTALSTTWVSSVNLCINGTGGEAISTGNYTTSVNSNFGVGSITNITSQFSAEPWNCTYDVYNISSPEYTLPDNASVGLAEYGNWFDIIVIVGVAAVILSLIFLAFGRKSEGSGVSY